MKDGQAVIERTFTVNVNSQQMAPSRRREPSWIIRRALAIMTTVGGLVFVLLALGFDFSDSVEESTTSGSLLGGVVKGSFDDKLIQNSKESSSRVRDLQFVPRDPQSVVNTITNQLNLRAYEVRDEYMYQLN